MKTTKHFTIRGQLKKEIVDPKGEEVSQKFDWASAVADAGIMAAIGFFTTAIALGATEIFASPVSCLLAAGLAAGLQFTTILAFKRGLVEKKTDG